MGLAAEQSGDADITARLDEIGAEPFLAKEATLLGDVEIDRGDATAGIGDEDVVEGLTLGGGAEAEPD